MAIGFGWAGAGSTTLYIESPLEDTVSELAWSPRANALAASSWDGQTRIWDVGASGAAPKAYVAHDGPALTCTWTPDGSSVVSGGADTFARLVDVNTNAKREVAKHEEPIKAVRFVVCTGGTVLVTGSWDRTIKYWDLRQQQPIGVLDIGEKCYAMDAMANNIVVATSNRKIHYINANNPATISETINSPLKFQSKSLAIFPGNDGFALGSIEGRVAIQYFVEGTKKNFAFRCHRTTKVINTVNCLAFNPVAKTFATGGGDGEIDIWDKDKRSKLTSWTDLGNAVTAMGYNSEGTHLAYATGYDWSLGSTGMDPSKKPKIAIRKLRKDEKYCR
ncbi:hypothetical protein EV182_003573 [Spiromyces aspiralis]|uniref:Uncharacterized protein n=1 Tax=Spiromyces aspiralis TaxID=68401 RepID=A0ACC1HQ82_9FUNG|nr:hypothetical protein EV182_003573 [Spiromyces aspiralis]